MQERVHGDELKREIQNSRTLGDSTWRYRKGMEKFFEI